MNPVADLIKKAIKEKNVKRSELATAVGYKNVTKGLRRIDALMRRGGGNRKLLGRIVAILEIDQRAMDAALVVVKNARKAEWTAMKAREEEYARQTFRPHVSIRHACSRPRSIAAVGWTGSRPYKYIEVPPEVTVRFLREQIEAVSAIVRNHYESKKGECYMFGKITGYVYRYDFDHGIEFSVDGKVTNLHLHHKGGKWTPQAKLSFKGKEIKGGMLSKLVDNDD